MTGKYQKKDKRKRYPVLLLVCLCTILVATGCTPRKKRTAKPTATPGVTGGQTADMTGVLRSIDTTGNIMVLHNILTDTEVSLTYSGATSFVSKKEQELAPSQLEIGEVVDIYSEDNTIKKVQISSKVETRDNVTPLTVNSQEMYVEIGSAKYKYTKGIVAISNGKPIDVMEITSMDTVSVRYVEGKVYSVIVTKGHGYIKPKNYKDFIGGMMTVEGQTMLPVTKKMLVAVPEGTYKVTMENGDFTGSRDITVLRDMEMALDMSLFKSQPADTGQVIFDINPKGAELYINGRVVSYKTPVSLKYGEHQVVVRLEGYSDYRGTLDVQSANPTVKINLAEEEAEISQDDDSKVTQNNSSDNQSEQSATVDNNHKITISQPAGVSVYLNGTYKGIAPCSFAKVIGSQTITLSQSGYVTKSYTVSILNDGEDILWNFPALTKSSS